MDNEKYSEVIMLFDVKYSSSIELLCNALEDGAIINLANIYDKINVDLLWGKGVFVNIDTKEEWNKNEFLRHSYRACVRINRDQLKPDLQKLSNTQIARKLGEEGLHVTMSEMHEKGKDVWGS